MNVSPSRPHRAWRAALPLLGVVALLGVIFSLWGVPLSTAQAAPPGQIPIYTPTPRPDGRIIYIVKPNDTLLGISLITGVSVEQLRALNNLTGDTIYEGQELLLGLAGPPEETPTVGPSPTPTPILPTPTPQPGFGTLCLLLFNDLNGNSIREANELSISGGAISFGNRAGNISRNMTSSGGQEHQCFDNLPEDTYSISVAIPEGYNPTTTTDAEVRLAAGERVYVNFGAQMNSQEVLEAPTIPAPEGGRSPLLGVIGGLFLLSGIGLVLFAGRLMRGR